MSAFEFVLVSFAILLGLGISSILAGWGDQARARHRLPFYPLQVASTAFILYFCLQYLWMLWMVRNADWTFPLFLGGAMPALAMSLAAQVSKVDIEPEAGSARDQYFRNSRVVYSLLATFPISILLMSLTSGLREIIPNPPNLLAVSLVRVVISGLWLSLAWSKSERFHWVGLSVMLFTALAFLSRFAFRLSESAT